MNNVCLGCRVGRVEGLGHLMTNVEGMFFIKKKKTVFICISVHLYHVHTYMTLFYGLLVLVLIAFKVIFRLIEVFLIMFRAA